MSRVHDLTSIVMLAIYIIILLSLLRPGGKGPDLVSSFGMAFAEIV